jgi:hypothetical protein
MWGYLGFSSGKRIICWAFAEKLPRENKELVKIPIHNQNVRRLFPSTKTKMDVYNIFPTR